MDKETTAIFTIFDTGSAFDVKCKRFNTYNKYGVPKSDLWKALSELTDIFNNVIKIAILFDYEG